MWTGDEINTDDLVLLETDISMNHYDLLQDVGEEGELREENSLSNEAEIYMQQNLSSPTGANLAFLNNHFEWLENNFLDDSDGCLEIESTSVLVLHPTITYPFRLFRLPKLTKFWIKFLVNVKSWKLFQHYLRNMNLPSLMPFISPGHTLYEQRNMPGWKEQLTVYNDQTDSEIMYEFQNLWTSGIDVKISINSVKVLVIERDTKYLLLNRLKKSIVEKIILGLNDDPAENVHLDHVEIDDLNKIPCDKLERLVLYGVKTNGEIMSFLRKCKRLRLFYCLQMKGEVVDFATDLHFTAPEGPSLTSIGLGNARLTCSSTLEVPIKNSHVEFLEIDECQCDGSFLLSIPNLFPNLKSFKFKGIMTLKMLDRFLCISSLNNIFIWKLETVPHFVINSPAVIREIKQKVIETVVNKNAHRSKHQRTIKIIEESVLKVLPVHNLKKICDQTRSYDMYAPENVNISKSLKKFLSLSTGDTHEQNLNFSKPICEAFHLQRLRTLKDAYLQMQLLKLKEIRNKPCSSQEVIDCETLKEEQCRWKSCEIKDRNKIFPFILAEKFGWAYPYPNSETIFELEGLVIHDVDRMDNLVQDTIEYYNAVY